MWPRSVGARPRSGPAAPLAPGRVRGDPARPRRVGAATPRTPAATLPALLLTMMGCTHHDPRPRPALLGPAPIIIGHRGAAAVAPENTLAAFRVARDLGVAIELDVTMSVDGQLVVIHDDTLDRTTSGAGFVDETPWAELSRLDAGAWHGPAFTGEPLPTLDRVFEEIGGSVPIDIELKSPRDRDRTEALAERVVDCIARHTMERSVFVTSFDPFVLAAVRERAPDLPRGQLVGTFSESDIDGLTKRALNGLWLNGRADVDMVLGEAAFLTAERVSAYLDRGYTVMAWTVNDPAEMHRLLDMGVTGIITDDPAMALRVLRGGPPG